MKWFLIFWGGPVAFLGAWYGLSYYDINFGLFILSRQMHDLVFQIYGQILGIPPAELPPLVLRAVLFDGLIVLGLLALRRRLAIFAWWKNRGPAGSQGNQPGSKESLSKAP